EAAAAGVLPPLQARAEAVLHAVAEVGRRLGRGLRVAGLAVAVGRVVGAGVDGLLAHAFASASAASSPCGWASLKQHGHESCQRFKHSAYPLSMQVQSSVSA